MNVYQTYVICSRQYGGIAQEQAKTALTMWIQIYDNNNDQGKNSYVRILGLHFKSALYCSFSLLHFILFVRCCSENFFKCASSKPIVIWLEFNIF